MENTPNKTQFQKMYNEEEEYKYQAENDSETDYLEDDTDEYDTDFSDDIDSENDYDDEFEESEEEFEPYDESLQDEIISCENCDWDWKLSEGGNDPFDCHNCGHSNEHLYIEPEEFYEEDGTESDFYFDSDFDEIEDFDDLDDVIEDIDFSQFTADNFSSNFSSAKKHIQNKKTKTIPLSNRVLLNTQNSKISNIKVPTERKVIIEGQERFKSLKTPVQRQNKRPTQQRVQRPISVNKKRPIQTRPLGNNVGINPNEFKIENIKVPTDRQVIIEGQKPIRQIKRPIQQKVIETKRPLSKPRPTIVQVKNKPEQRPEILKRRPIVEPTKKVKQYQAPKRPTVRPQRPVVPKTVKRISVERRAQINSSQKKIARVLVPTDRKVIIEGVNKFILSQKPTDDSVKNIGYYKGKKLKEMVFIFNNDTPNPFTIELFNPSAHTDYLYNTSQNLNDKIEVAGGQVAYSDVVYNLLANPTWIHNCKFTFGGALSAQQKSTPLQIIDRQITGQQYIEPLNLNLTVDNMQVNSDVIFFDISSTINRPFIPDGMDTIKYTILPNMSVVMGFYYEQVTQKDLYFAKSDTPKHEQ
jgi:hypothetical protein